MSKGPESSIQLIPIFRFIDRLVGRFRSEVSATGGTLALPSLTSLGRQSQIVRTLVQVYENGAIETRTRAAIVNALEAYEFAINRLDTGIRRGVKAQIIAGATGDKFEDGFAKEQARQVGNRLRDLDRATNDLRRAAEASSTTDAGRAVFELLNTHPISDQEGRESEIWGIFRAEIESEQGRLPEQEGVQQVQQEAQLPQEGAEGRDLPRGRLGDNRDSAGPFSTEAESSTNLSERVGSAIRSIREQYGQLPENIRHVVEEQARNVRDLVVQRIQESMSNVQGQNQGAQGDGGGAGGDEVDARPPTAPRDVARDSEAPPARRARFDTPDSFGAAGKSAGIGNTTEFASRMGAPNQVVAPSTGHLGKFDHAGAIDLADSTIAYAAQESGSSVLLTDAVDMFVQMQAQQPTYRFSSAGHRGDVTADTRCKLWQLSSTTRIGDSQVTPGGAGTTFAGFIGATFPVRIFQNPMLQGEQYFLNEAFKDANPPPSTDAQKWYYILEQQNRVGGTFSETVLSRAMEAQARDRTTGSLQGVLCRLIADLGWFRAGLVNDAAPEMGGARITMRSSDDKPIWRSWPYQQTSASGQFINEPLSATGFWNEDDLQRLRNLDAASASVTRIIRSNMGDNSKNVVGERADGSLITAVPEGWSLENTLIIPIRSTDANQPIANWYWLRSHLGLTFNVDKEVNCWWPNETANGEDIRTWFTGIGTVSFAPSAFKWSSMDHVQHILFCFVDRGSIGTDIALGDGFQQRVIETATDTGEMVVAQNILNFLQFQPDVDTATVDHSSYVLTAIQRFDEMYRTTQEEIHKTMMFLSRQGVWCNELPKGQQQQGLGPDDFGSNCMNIPLTESNVLYNSWANQQFRNNYVPTIAHPTARDVTSMLGVWANAKRTVMRPSRVAHDIALHGVHLSQVAGVQFDFGTAYGSFSSVGGMGVHEMRGLTMVARSMNVLQLPGLRMRAASIDWLSALAGPIRQAGDILSFALDDALAMNSISVREASWYEGNNLDGDGLYLLKGKMQMNVKDIVNKVINPEGACWKMDVQNWGQKDSFVESFDYEFDDNITGVDVFEGISRLMDASKRQGTLALPSRVADHVLALEASGPTRDYAMAIVKKTAVDFSTTGATVLSEEQPPNIINQQRVGQLLPQMLFSSDTPYMTTSDLRLLSKVQNVSLGARRTEAFQMDEVACSPTPFIPIESNTILAPSADPQNMFATTLIDFAFRMPCSASDATKDLRVSSRIRLQRKPWVWSRIGIKTSSQLARMNGGVNPGLPFTVVQIGEFSSMPLFDQENAGEGDPRRQLSSNPDFLN